MRKFPFQAVEEKSANQKGKYWDPAAHSQPETMRVSYTSEKSGSSLDEATQQVAAKKVATSTTGGSLEQAPIVAPAKASAVENSGSVANQAPVAKPTTEKGSIDQ